MEGGHEEAGEEVRTSELSDAADAAENSGLTAPMPEVK